MILEIGKTVPDFTFEATSNLKAKLSDYRGTYVILYFYPKDKTPGCTSESIDFTEKYTHFLDKKAVVFGLSRDSIKSHESFKEKYRMPFELISDSEERICKLFDVLKEKSMFGKKYMGIERSTFVIDPNGVLIHQWRKVKVKGHVDEVLKTLN